MDWINIKDRLPEKDIKLVLVYTEGEEYTEYNYTFARWADGKFLGLSLDSCDCGYADMNITHWSYLEPPTVSPR